jgi:peptidoglycan hydrolase CwlO-like protein
LVESRFNKKEMTRQLSFITASQVNFILNNPWRTNHELSQMLRLTVKQIHEIRDREGVRFGQTENDIQQEIDKINAEIVAIQNKINWAQKTAENRQRALKAKIDQKREYLRDLKAIAS